jgi:hypothetical protein
MNKIIDIKEMSNLDLSEAVKKISDRIDRELQVMYSIALNDDSRQTVLTGTEVKMKGIIDFISTS